MNGYSLQEYERIAVDVAQVTSNVLTQRRGTDPAMVRQWLLTRSPTGDVWMFAVLDDQAIPDLSPYANAAHHLSTSLRGMKVLVSNHTGFRLAFLLSPVRRLPKRISLPDGYSTGRLLIGQQASGGLAGGEWDKIGHMVVAGMTGSGKSYTVRSLVYQAIKQGFDLLLGDLDNNTFPMLAGHPALLAPLAEDEDGFVAVLERAMGEIEHRKRLYKQAASFPENIDEYNRWAEGAQVEPLKRLLVVLDEFNSAIENSGGVNGELASLATRLVWRGRKFGVTFVMASQDFSKDVLGKVRDQVGAMIVHRVRSADVARNMGLAAAAQISAERPGRALTDRWGLIQSFFLDKQLLISGQAVDALTDDERRIAERSLDEMEGKISREVLTDFGMGQREARRLQEEWRARGWAFNDPARANGLYITPKLVDLLTNRPTRPTLTNPRPTDQPGDQPDQPILMPVKTAN